MYSESDELERIVTDRATQTHFFGEVPHQFKKASCKNSLYTSTLKKQRLIENIDPRFKHLSYLTESQMDLMNDIEIRVHNFLEKMIVDYDVLACNALEKCSKKDLNGKIKVYTDKLTRLPSIEYYINTKDNSTQTKILPHYMQPLDKNKYIPQLK